MLKNITLGQYFAGNSFIHRLEPRAKILLILLFIIMLFMDSRFFTLLFGFAYVLTAVYLSKIKVSMFVKSVKPIFPLLLLTAVFIILQFSPPLPLKLSISGQFRNFQHKPTVAKSVLRHSENTQHSFATKLP